MKKIYHYENLSGAGLVTGRAVRLILDSDGSEVDCVEIGATGKYLAELTDFGIYSVFDVTSGSPGVDLDQKIDFFSSQTIAQQITFPGDASLFLDGDEAFRAVEMEDISGLSSAISDKEPVIAAAGNAKHAWFGNKAFRAIAMDDLPSEIEAETVVASAYCEFEGLPGPVQIGTLELRIVEIRKSKAYGVILKTGGNTNNFSSASTYARRVKATVSVVSGSIMARFLDAIVANSGIGIAAILNLNMSTGSQKMTMNLFSLSRDGSTLYVNSGNWEINDMYGALTFTGMIING